MENEHEDAKQHDEVEEKKEKEKVQKEITLRSSTSAQQVLDKKLFFSNGQQPSKPKSSLSKNGSKNRNAVAKSAQVPANIAEKSKNVVDDIKDQYQMLAQSVGANKLFGATEVGGKDEHHDEEVYQNKDQEDEEEEVEEVVVKPKKAHHKTEVQKKMKLQNKLQKSARVDKKMMGSADFVNLGTNIIGGGSASDADLDDNAVDVLASSLAKENENEDENEDENEEEDEDDDEEEEEDEDSVEKAAEQEEVEEDEFPSEVDNDEEDNDDDADMDDDTDDNDEDVNTENDDAKHVPQRIVRHAEVKKHDDAKAQAAWRAARMAERDSSSFEEEAGEDLSAHTKMGFVLDASTESIINEDLNAALRKRELTSDQYCSTLKTFLDVAPSRAITNEGSKTARDHIMFNLADLGFHVLAQPITDHDEDFGEKSAEMGMTNILASRFRTGESDVFPEQGQCWVLLGAHYDSSPFKGAAPGADASASGVSALLNTAATIQKASVVGHTGCEIVYAFFTGGEMKQIGSEAFVKRYLDEDSTHFRPGFRGAFIVDRVGYNEPFLGNKIRLRVETADISTQEELCGENHQHLRMTNAIQQAAAKTDRISLQISDAVISDHTPFLDNNFAAVLLMGSDAAHQPFAR